LQTYCGARVGGNAPIAAILRFCGGTVVAVTLLSVAL
jgi:hypothetical protein